LNYLRTALLSLQGTLETAKSKGANVHNAVAFIALQIMGIPYTHFIHPKIPLDIFKKL